MSRLKKFIADNEDKVRSRVLAFDLEDSLYRGQGAQGFLGLPQAEQRKEWHEAFIQFEKQEKKEKPDHCFLGVHLVYHWGQIPSCAVNFRDIIRWRPDCIITLVDDAPCVRYRVHKGGYVSFALAELLTWRAEELMIGDLLARMACASSIPNFLVAIKHRVSMLANLLASVDGTNLHRRVARLYTSYPITEPRKDAASRALLDAFRARIAALRNCAAFDPLTIDELPVTTLKPVDGVINYDARDPNHRWPLSSIEQLLGPDDDIEYPIQLPAIEVEPFKSAGLSRKGDFSSQVLDRDLRLVDQSHCICAWRPTFQSAHPSVGVLVELRHAQATGKRRIQYVKMGEDPLPNNPLWSSGGPDDIYDESDDRLWTVLADVHSKAHSDYDAFLQ